MNMSKFEIWIENSDLGYYATNGENYVEYLINKWNGVVVRCYFGENKAQVKNSDGTWMEYSYKKLVQDLSK